MDFREIKRIVELMDQHGLSVFKLEQGETKLELKKGGDLDVKAIQNWMSSSPAPQYAPAYPQAAAPAGAPAVEAGLPTNLKEVTSPMVGTFYTASSPDSEPFVKVGTKVESLYRDIRALRIYEGATEVQQLIIGKSVLKG